MDILKLKALKSFLELDTLDEVEDYLDDYLVLTDSEADNTWEEYLDSYIEDCVISELPETYRAYFDCEAFKRDCKMDGRGHSLSTYDGEEHEVKIEDTYFYIYRIN